MSCPSNFTIEQDGDEKDEERFREPVRRQAGTHPPRQTGPFEHEGEIMLIRAPVLLPREAVIFAGVFFCTMLGLESWPRLFPGVM